MESICCDINFSWKMSRMKATFKGVRSSKFRHVFGDQARKENCYECYKISKNAHDSYFCAVNPKFVAIVEECAGGGSFIVLLLEQTGRIDLNCGRVTGHRAPVLDIKWNPFNDNVIASCSDDTTVKLWYIPDEGLHECLNEPLIELSGHRRRVGYIEWHPTAENILFSSGFDHLIIIWDVGRGEMVQSIDCHPNCVYSMSFNRDGSLLATTCKDKVLRIIDPRKGKVLQQGTCHIGSKAAKVVFLGDSGRLMTTGFSKFSDRQWAIWSQQDLSSPLHMETVDSSSGILIPYYDHDTKMVYLVGKGDGNIRYYEIVNEAPWCYYLSQFMTGLPQRGLGVMPKRGLNVRRCEVFRFYKLHTSKNMCEPISMIVPRKSDQFQTDIYPDTAAPTPSLSADEWLSGKNRNPILISLKSGLIASTHKPMMYQNNKHLLASDHNNDRKFRFISEEAHPDYRGKTNNNNNNEINNENVMEVDVSSNFKQLQQFFVSSNDEPKPGHVNGSSPTHQSYTTNGTMCDIVASHTLPTATYVTICAADDSQVAPPDSTINDDLILKSDSELLSAYNKQKKTVEDLREQLRLKDKRIMELEAQLVKPATNHLQRV